MVTNGDGNVRLKRHYSLIGHSADVVELRYGVWNPVSHVIRDDAASGHLFPTLSLLDGSHSIAEIAQTVHVTRDEVESLVDHLTDLGVVETGSSNALDQFLDHIVPTLSSSASPGSPGRPIVLAGDDHLCAEIQRYLGASLVDVQISMAQPDIHPLSALNNPDLVDTSDSLEFQRVVDQFEDWRDRFIVMAMTVMQPRHLGLLNKVSLALGFQWMHAAIDGPFLLVGPIFIPGETACYDCFETRVTMNLRETASYLTYKNTLLEGRIRFGSAPVDPILAGLLATHTALEAMNWTVAGSSFTVGKVLSIYLPTMEFAFHEVFKVPGCASCQPVSNQGPELYFDVRSLMPA